MYRRELLLGLAALCLIPPSGCALLQRESELDSLFDELESLLADIPPPNGSSARAIASDLRDKSSQLLDVHQKFLITFNDQAVDRQVTADSLRKTTASYHEQRILLRNQLLFLQDDLYQVLPESSRAEAREILNRKAPSLMPQQWKVT